ncbi:MAG: protein-disulfide reductase DsbD family protein [Cytophagales bacterium]|nr:protein-disulfide reductase DsbD family protein [Cytophagales bacterium]
MKYSLLILLSFSILSGTSQPKTEIVKLTVPKICVDQGNSSTIKIGVEVKEGYHIQANQLDDEYLMPTTLTIKADTNIIIGKQVFPQNKKFRLEGSDDYWNVYDGSFDISILFKTKEIIQKGRYNLAATFHYQACDSKSCLSPRTIDFLLTIEVTEQRD